MSDSQQHYRISLNPKEIVIGAQMLFVAFGALVLVPLLTGLNANVALFTAGAGTLIFQVVTRGKVPVFLASSFAFIAPIIYGVNNGAFPAPCVAWQQQESSMLPSAFRSGFLDLTFYTASCRRS